MAVIVARFTRLALVPPSPTPHLLTTNDVPTPAEEKQIEAYIRRLDGEVNGTSKKDNFLSKHLTQELIRVVHAHRQLLRTSARNLPPEIIQKISLYILLPWTLSWVCAAWRNATKDYKKLWSVFPTLELSPKKNTKPLKLMGFTKEILRRSGDHSLSVDLRAFELSDTRPLFTFFLQQANRWVEARLELHSGLVAEFQKATSGMTNLRHLTIAVSKEEQYDGQSSYLDLKSLVSLRSLRNCTPWPTPVLLLPSDTIASYVGKIPGAELINHLKLLSSTLETLVLTCNLFTLYPTEVARLFLFPKLTEIALYEGPLIFRSNSSPFLYMTTPYLRTARISQCSPQTFHSFCKMVLRSGAGLTLTTLHIWSGDCIDYDSLRSLLTNTPNITDLKLSDQHFSDPGVLSLLSTANEGFASLLPKLERLTVFFPWIVTPTSLHIFRSLHTIGLLRMQESFIAYPLTSTRRLQSFEVGLSSKDYTTHPYPRSHEKQNINRLYLDPHWQYNPEESVLRTLEGIAFSLSIATETIQEYDIGQGKLGQVVKVSSKLEIPLRRLRDLTVPLMQEVYVRDFLLSAMPF